MPCSSNGPLKTSAEWMSYRKWKTQEIIEEFQSNNGHFKAIDNFLYSLEYLDAVRSGHIQPKNTVLMLSIDGAQLYAHKAMSLESSKAGSKYSKAMPQR